MIYKKQDALQSHISFHIHTLHFSTTAFNKFLLLLHSSHSTL